MTGNHLLLYRLAELMLEHEQHVLPVDLLFDDEHIGDFVKSIQIDSPYQKMLLEGVLTESVRDEKLNVNFTVEGYFHYVLGEVIYNKTKGHDAEALKQIIEANKLNGVKEGVEQCLIRDVQKDDLSRVIWLIDIGGDFINLSIAPLANLFALQNVDYILTLLLKNETENDFAALFHTISFLKKQNKIELIDSILEMLENRYRENKLFTNQFYFTRIRIASLMYGSQTEIVKLAETTIENKTKITSEINDIHLPTLLLDFYNILVNKGHLKLSTSFAFKFHIYDFEPNILIDNYYNILYPLLETGQFELAERIYLQCKSTHENNGVFMNWSGFIFQSWYELKSQDPSHLEKGLDLYEKSSELIEKELGSYSIRKYENLENLGYAYGLKGDYEKSLVYLNRAINIVAKTYRTEIIYPLGNLYGMKAVTLNELGKHTEALEFTYISDKCKLLQVEADSPELAWNHYDRAQIYTKMAKKPEAINSMLAALRIREQSLGFDNELTIQTRKEYEKLINDN